MDFGEIKAILKSMCGRFDHCFIYERETLDPVIKKELLKQGFTLIEVHFRPTAEEFAYYFFRQLSLNNVPVHRVEVYETPNNCAVYEE